MEQHIAKINNAIDKAETVVIGANCEVAYSGKAESFLPAGDRVIMIKSDKTLLVHQPDGVAPINYMKEKTSHRIISNEDGVFLKSQNLFLKDYMDIKLNEIHFVQSHGLEDGQKIQLNGSEADMSDMIYNQPELIEPGFNPCSREEHTKFGFIDVFGTDSDGKVVIIECKRDCADFKAVSQLQRYVKKVAKTKGIKHDQIRGIIASQKITPNAKEMLREHGFEFKSIKPPKYTERYDKKQKKIGEY